MILSARVIQIPEKIRQCAWCEQPIMASQLKLYGMAHSEEKPYNIFFHPDCSLPIGVSQEPKIQDALGILREKLNE